MRFDACARDYDAHAEPQRDFAARVAHFARVPPDSEILELGAGTGALTRHMAAIDGVHIRATDVSREMVSIGRGAVPKAEWAVLDAFGGELPSSSLQISSGLLQWADDPAGVLKMWARSIHPGGRMVHAFPCEPCLREWRLLVPHSPVVWREESAWMTLFTSAHLRVLRRVQWIERYLFPSALEMLRDLHNSGVTGASALNAGRLRRQMRSYDQRHRTSAGVVATWAWMAVEAAPEQFRSSMQS